MKVVNFGYLLPWLLCSQAVAGGIAWPFKVVSFEERDSGEFSIRLSPIEKGDEFPNFCENLEVNGSYSSVRWFFLGAEYMTKENNSVALKYLEQAHREGRVIQFGVMGTGLHSEKGVPCKAISRGLAVIMSESNESMVLSYYKWP